MLRLAAWLSPSMSIGLMRENTGPANFKAGHAAYQSTHNLFVLRKRWSVMKLGNCDSDHPTAARTQVTNTIRSRFLLPRKRLQLSLSKQSRLTLLPLSKNTSQVTIRMRRPLRWRGTERFSPPRKKEEHLASSSGAYRMTELAKTQKLDKIHQPIAAAHGAAFAYELLDYWGDNRRAPERTDVVDPPSTIEPAQQDPGPVDTLPIQPAPIAEDVLDETSIAVLSFAGSEADFPQARQKVILDVIRNITGNPAIEIVGSQAGSFYLFLRVNEPDLVSLQSPELRSALSEKAEARLLGVASKEDFERSRQEIEELLTASRSVLDWPRALPDGTVIERPEINQLLEPAPDHQGRTKAVIGDPGSGKTALLAALAERLRNSRIPFLAIKADILDTSITSENDLQRDLGLSDLPSRILTWLSRRGPVYLIIDQLDALARYVDLRTGRLSVLLSLIRALGNQPNVCVVVSARRFEYEHDTRLKSAAGRKCLPRFAAVE
ncbi:hypothetical protein ACVWWP_006651 [Bradyrhizobium sp. LM3.6]